MKYYIIAGEASGDLHGSHLISELKKLDPDAGFRCYGGDLMKREGAHIVRHVSELDFMGFWEILVNLRTILRMIRECKEDIAVYKPDAIILIDYPGFNLRIAEFARKSGFKVFYYVSPQIWAWKQSRIYKIKRNVDRLFVILPFEKEFYARFGFEVDFVGHPLLDAIETFRSAMGPEAGDATILDGKPLIALLPGSRKQEVRRILPVMLDVASSFDERYRFVIAGSTSVSDSFYRKIIGKRDVPIIFKKTYPLLLRSEAAIVTSGTATLETALFNVPQVVCYKANPISFLIAKRLVRLKYISLVNLIMDKPVVKELIQGEMNEETVACQLRKILFDQKNREQILADYVELKRKLGGKGASRVTAELIMKYLD
ncbi:MAG: lipid-A-disaccharide synthase [Bacteroidales bacterium]